MEDGAIKKLDDHTWLVNPAELVFNTNSVIPSTTVKTNQEEMSENPFGIPSMNVSAVSESKHSITIYKNGSEVTAGFSFNPIQKNAPVAMWGKEPKAETSGANSLIKDLLMGVKIKPKARKKPNETEDKLVSDFN